MSPSSVSESSLGNGGMPALALYRGIMFIWALYIGLNQLVHRGPIVFIYYTVWNWWLLITFFALARWVVEHASSHIAAGSRMLFCCMA
jgi:hypothetical protein